jgi:hypothetical protein
MNMLDQECTKPVEQLKGEYVKRAQSAKTVYRVEGYCPYTKRWELADCKNANRCIYIKPGTLLFAGFTY